MLTGIAWPAQSSYLRTIERVHHTAAAAKAATEALVGQSCLICQEELLDDVAVHHKGGPCGLYCRCTGEPMNMHELCLRTHLARSARCPICREEARVYEGVPLFSRPSG